MLRLHSDLYRQKLDQKMKFIKKSIEDNRNRRVVQVLNSLKMNQLRTLSAVNLKKHNCIQKWILVKNSLISNSFKKLYENNIFLKELELKIEESLQDGLAIGRKEIQKLQVIKRLNDNAQNLKRDTLKIISEYLTLQRNKKKAVKMLLSKIEARKIDTIRALKDFTEKEKLNSERNKIIQTKVFNKMKDFLFNDMCLTLKRLLNFSRQDKRLKLCQSKLLAGQIRKLHDDFDKSQKDAFSKLRIFNKYYSIRIANIREKLVNDYRAQLNQGYNQLKLFNNEMKSKQLFRDKVFKLFASKIWRNTKEMKKGVLGSLKEYTIISKKLESMNTYKQSKVLHTILNNVTMIKHDVIQKLCFSAKFDRLKSKYNQQLLIKVINIREFNEKSMMADALLKFVDNKKSHDSKKAAAKLFLIRSSSSNLM